MELGIGVEWFSDVLVCLMSKVDPDMSVLMIDAVHNTGSHKTLGTILRDPIV